MNPDSHEIIPQPAPALPKPAPPPKMEGGNQSPQELRTLKKKSGRGIGKIARLPNATRERLNLMLRDGVKYKEIIAKLGDDAKGLVPRNLSTWLKSPSYQLWLLEQDWREELRTIQQAAIGLAADFDSASFNQGALQLSVTRLFQALRHLDSGDLNQRLGGNAQSFARLVTALARASRETTNLEKFRQAAAEALAAQARQAKRAASAANPITDVIKEWDKAFRHYNATQPEATPSPNGNGNGNGPGNGNGNSDNPALPATDPLLPSTLNPQPSTSP